MITFQRERVRDVWDEILPLARHHSEMSQHYRRHEPFAPSKERYRQYDEAEVFHLLTGRDHGILAGYLGLYFVPSMHSQWLLVREDTFFLDPLYRGGRTAFRFLDAMEAYCLATARAMHLEQAELELLFSCEEDNVTGIRKLLLHRGYAPGILQFTKRLSLIHGADSALLPVGDHASSSHLTA